METSSGAPHMLLLLLLFFFFFFVFFPWNHQLEATSADTSFTDEAFDPAGFDLSGCANMNKQHGSLLQLTNFTLRCSGLAFRSIPVPFRSSSQPREILSFSTTFVVAIIPKYKSVVSFGMAFVISPSNHIQLNRRPPFFGIFNSSNNGSASNHILAVVLNEIRNSRVGVHVNGVAPQVWRRAAYYEEGRFKNISFADDQILHVSVDYDAKDMEMYVTMSPFRRAKANLIGNRPFLSTKINLSDVILNTMYIGFSATTGNAPTSHFVLGWSFRLNGRAPPLDLSRLPVEQLPKTTTEGKPSVLTTLISFLSSLAVLVVVTGVVLAVRRRIKFAEVIEDWEVEYGPHRFSYKDLYVATKGFNDSKLLGVGGFGKVYKGVLPKSESQVAVKKISHDSKQGMREFVSEIVSMGRLRHRNLVRLLGYCRRKGELLLVYDFMPNGSLDKFLFNRPKVALDWNQRFHIIKGVASGLHYLHEGWEQLVVHRDVKSGNVLLDGGLNGRLGDFGLARMYDHGTNPETTHLVGTLGYIAPELTITGKATTSTDVFAYGVFLLEVSCGRRPIEPHAPNGDMITTEWVLKNWTNENLLSSVDPSLEMNYVAEEAELVLKLGLLCSHSQETARPSMRQVLQFLEGENQLPKLSTTYWKDEETPTRRNVSFEDYMMSYSPTSVAAATSSMVLSSGR